MLLSTAAASAAAAQVEPDPCVAVDLDSPRSAIQTADVIVVGTIASNDDGHTTIEPEAYLKGPATGRVIVLGARDDSTCAPASVADGDRVIAMLATGADEDTADWPGEGRTFVVNEGQTNLGGAAVSEETVIEALREVTGVYAVPAGSDAGISFNLSGSILPVGIVIGAIFGIGLVLMRVWHRIDPS